MLTGVQYRQSRRTVGVRVIVSDYKHVNDTEINRNQDLRAVHCSLVNRICLEQASMCVLDAIS
jgi:hypothetical protein